MPVLQDHGGTRTIQGEVRTPRDVNVDAHHDRKNRVANGKARAMRRVGTATGQRKAITVVSDMLGGQQPASAIGNTAAWSWTTVGRDHNDEAHAKEVYVSFGPNSEATQSLAGFEQMCQEAGLTVCRDAVAQSIEVICDNGTEFMGAFRDGMDRAGITTSNSTAHSTQKGMVELPSPATRSYNSGCARS